MLVTETRGRVGNLAEKMVKASLRSKAIFQESEELDHTYKLDLVINKFTLIEKFISVGVQLTTRPGDADKMDEFLSVMSKSQIVERALYVEIDAETALTDSGAELTYAALVSFAFQVGARGKRVLGARIGKNLLFEYFDIESSIEEIRAKTRKVEAEQVKSQMVEGSIGFVSYFDPAKGFGFIANENKEWFFHIYDVVDDGLAKNIANSKRDGKNRLNGPKLMVCFDDIGLTRDGVRNPQAKRVVPIK